MVEKGLNYMPRPMIHNFTQGPILRHLLIFSTPLMGANLMQMLYNMIDMVVIGQFVGKIGLSAVSIGGEVMNLATFIALGFSTAGQVILSQLIGAGRKEHIKETIQTMFVVLLSAAILLSGIGLLSIRQILEVINTPAEAMESALDYTRICISGLLFIYGYNLIGAVLRGLGDSKHPFLFICIASLTNLVLDLVFVAVFKLGVAGAALATVIGQGVSFLCSFLLLYRRQNEFGLDIRLNSFRVDRDILCQLIHLGLPMSLQSAAVSVSMMFVNSFINAYGVVASAATGAGFKLCTFISVVTQALASGGSTIVGQNLGAKKYERVSLFFWSSLAINLCFAALFSILTVLFPRKVFGIFTQEAEVLEMTMRFLPCAVIDYFGFAARSPTNALVNGSGHAGLNLFMGIMDGIVSRIGLAVLLGIVLNLGILGFWYGSACSGLVPFMIGLIFFLSGKWKAENNRSGA